MFVKFNTLKVTPNALYVKNKTVQVAGEMGAEEEAGDCCADSVSPGTPTQHPRMLDWAMVGHCHPISQSRLLQTWLGTHGSHPTCCSPGLSSSCNKEKKHIYYNLIDSGKFGNYYLIQ